jgi:DNA polymerase I-like protein with 3'-5' exonuclease and polymerase domains
VQVLGEIIVSRCSVSQSPKLSRVQYEDIIRKFFEKYEEFKEYIGNIKLLTDIII